MTWEEYWQSLPGSERGTAGSRIPDLNIEYPGSPQGVVMLAQDDQAYWDAYYASIGMVSDQPQEYTAQADDQAYWEAYYATLAASPTYEESLMWGLPSLAVIPEAALADSEATLQQAMQDSQLLGQPMTDSQMQAYIDSQTKQIMTAFPSEGSGILQKLKDFGSNLTMGGGSGGGSGGSSGSIPRAQLPVTATPASGTAGSGSGISSTMMIALAALAAVAFFASSGHSRA
jgi:hypothetical protein